MTRQDDPFRYRRGGSLALSHKHRSTLSYMQMSYKALPSLPCPECRTNGLGGGARIGNNRSTCDTCNNFAQNVMRRTRQELKERYADEYEQIRLRVELDLYPKVMEEWVNGR